MGKLTRDDVINLLGIEEEFIEKYEKVIEGVLSLSKEEGVNDVAFLGDVLDGRITLEVLHVVMVDSVLIAVLGYEGEIPTEESVLEDLLSEDPTIYNYIQNGDYYRSDGLFRAINYNKPDGTVEIEQLAVTEEEPYSVWVELQDLRIVK